MFVYKTENLQIKYSKTKSFQLEKLEMTKSPIKYHHLGIIVFVNHVSMQKQLYWYMVFIKYTHILYIYI